MIKQYRLSCHKDGSFARPVWVASFWLPVNVLKSAFVPDKPHIVRIVTTIRPV